MLCAVWGAGKLGMAYYHVDMAYLYIMSDVAESEDFGMLRRSKNWNQILCIRPHKLEY